MSNLFNHKCLIRKKKGVFSNEDLMKILVKIETNNSIYSDYYISMNTNELKLEYVAKSYPMIFEEDDFLSNFYFVDIFSDGGGAIDSINLTQGVYKALYEFDEIQFEGGARIVGAEGNKETETISLDGTIMANTYNQEITEISNNGKKIINIDEGLREKMITDCLEIWSIKIDDSRPSGKLMDLIKNLEFYPQKRNFDNFTAIKFLNRGKMYFEISWHHENKIWEEKRKFDLWEIVKI